MPLNKTQTNVSHLATVYSLYLKQVTHFILYHSLFGDNYGSVVANKLSYQANWQRSVTMRSEGNLKGSAKPVDYLELWSIFLFVKCQISS